ncbi:MAG: hypothetical protein Q7N95_17120 [Alphaproteobacteria bacterium]|nr:hypothetical protein [Alphaproteobacteria bacterium]
MRHKKAISDHAAPSSSTFTYRIREQDFPAITICALNELAMHMSLSGPQKVPADPVL